MKYRTETDTQLQGCKPHLKPDKNNTNWEPMTELKSVHKLYITSNASILEKSFIRIRRIHSKIGVCRGKSIFLIFAPKYRLWVLVRTASARRTCTHTICFEQNGKKNNPNFGTENFHFLHVQL